MKRFLLLFVLLWTNIAFATIVVTSPNGSESWNSCSANTITWTSSGTSGYFDIDYSIDGGSNWTSVATSLSSAGSFSWTLPNVSSVNCLVRVSDAQNSADFDVSNQSFAINAGLIIQYPNQGQTFIAGTSVNVVYAYQSASVNNIRVQFRPNPNAAWQTITSSVAANGSYNLTIPNYATSQAQLRLTDLSNPTCKVDTLDTPFTILSSLDVLAPDGGESWEAVTGTQGTVVLMSNVDENISVANFYDNGGLNSPYTNQSFTKTLSPDNPFGKLSLKLQEYSFENGDQLKIYNGPTTSSPLLATLTGSSSTPLTYTSTSTNGQLTVSFISDGDNNTSSGWDAYFNTTGLASKNIQWSRIGTSDRYHFEYSVNGGSNWTRILSDIDNTSGSFLWPLPNIPTDSALIKIIDAGNESILDISDSLFEIAPASPIIKLLEPNSGTYTIGDFVAIKWSRVFGGSNVKLEYSTDDGQTWTTIISSYSSPVNTYTWQVPSTPTTLGKIRVSDASDPSSYDDSDGNFTIRPYITGVGLNTSSLVRCSSVTLSWQGYGTSGTYRVDQSLDGGVSWTTLTSNRTGTNWPHTLPNVITSGLRYRVMDVSDTTRTAQSTTYSISDLPNPVALATLNWWGLSWVAGTQQTISYTTPSTVSSVTLQWSSNGGQSWGTIYNGAPTGSYSWTVPNVATTTAKLRLQNNGNVCDYDESDSVFTILSSVQVQQPNGGESWQAQVVEQSFVPGNTLNMSNATLEVNTLDYYDAGGTGSAPATAYTQTLVPDNPQNKLRIAFQSYRFDQPANSYYYGADGYLRVYNGPTTSSSILATLTNNDGGQVYTSSHYTGALTIQYVPENHSSTGYRDFHARVTSVGTPTKEIKWSVVGTSEKYHLDYSTDGGSSWKRIITGYEPAISSAGIAKYDWQVPNAVTSTAKVRVVDVANGNIIDQSDANFAITAADPYYHITTPNSGAYSIGQSVDVKWLTAFNGSNVAIDYWSPSSSSWVTLTSSYPDAVGGITSTEGTYTWTVPNDPGTSRLRVRDAQNSASYDTTNNFTIRPYITGVGLNTSSLVRCSSVTLSWQGYGTSGTYRVDQSLDGGVSWTTLTSNRTGTNWPHTLPNVITSGLRYRVMDVSDTTRTAQSTTYSISDLPNPVALATLNWWGLSWVAGTQQTISYTTPSTVSSVTLQWSSNGGQSWGTIYNGAPTGSYSWTVPNVATTTAKLRLQNNGNVCDYDESDSVFTILSSVQVQQPNGGESWQAQVVEQSFVPGNTLNMSNATLEVNTLDYYDAGGTGSAPATAYTQTLVPDNPQNKLRIAFQSYRFDQPANSYYYGADGYLRVYNGPTTSSSILATLTNNDGGQVYTSSHYTGALTIQYVPENHSSTGYRDFHARVTSVGTPTKEIKWSVVGTSEKYHLDYSTDGGSSWKRIITGYEPAISSAGIAKYDWQVPNAVTSTAKVRVVDVANGNIIDQSDANFAITAADPYYHITTPNSGAYSIGQSVDVKWLTAFNGSNVAIDYWSPSSSSWVTLTSSYPDAVGGITSTEGTYTWTVPNDPGTSRLRVRDAQNSASYDTTNNFTIRPYITGVGLNTSSLVRCSSVTLSWQGYGTSGTYRVDQSLDGGVSWTTLTSNRTGTNWPHTLPNVITSGLRYRVMDVSDTTRTAQSTTYSISDLPNPVALATLNWWGLSWVAGTQQTISYTTPSTVSSVTLQWSSNGGQSWGTIYNGAPTGSYSWTVPNVATTTAKLRLQNNGNVCDYDESDSVFTILSSVQVQQPNGGESWQAQVVEQSFVPGNTLNMSNATLEVNTLDYYDAGGTGSAPATAYTQTLVPDNPQNKLRIAFQSYRFDQPANSYYYGADGYLRVYNGPTTSSSILATLTNNDGGQVYTSSHYTGALTIQYVPENHSSTGYRDFHARVTSVGTPTKEIKWSVVGTSEKYHLDYSTDGGSSWKRIITGYEPAISSAGIAKYDWQVPNAVTSTAKVRVVDVANGNIIDQSDANFAITAADPYYHITTPNSGAYSIGQSVDVKWLTAFNGSNVAIDYWSPSSSSWVTLTSSYPDAVGGITSTEGTYTWTVPNDPGTSRLRVRDAQNSASYDTTNNFTIRPYITGVGLNTSSLVRCSSVTLSWQGYGTSGTYRVDQSLDGGVSWTTLTSNRTGTNWPHTLPNVITSGLRYRVMDVSDTTRTAQSTTYSISDLPNPVALATLNWWGLSWVAGTQQTISYTTPSTVSSVTLQWSSNGGQSWGTIYNGAPTGSYSWTVPNVATTTAKLRLQNNGNVCDYDESDSVFTILSSVQVQQPNGGESWQAQVVEQSFVPGNTLNMSNATLEVNTLDYYDAGGTGSAPATAYTQTLVPDNPQNKLRIAFQSYRFDQPANSYYYGADGYLRVYNGPTTSSSILATLTNNDGGQVYTSSHYTGALTIQYVPENHSSTGYRDFHARVTSVGTPTKEIKWSVVGTSEKYHLDYSTDGGSSWKRIITGYEPAISSAGIAKYDWQVPNAVTSTAKVRVVDVANGNIIDQSDANFAITAADPYYHITTPNSGAYSIGQSVDVKWLTAFNGSNVAIDYWSPSSSSWVTLTSSYPDAVGGITSTEGTYTWTVPNDPGTSRLRVRDAQNSASYDTTNNFTIRPYITGVGLNTSSLVRCSSVTLSWQGYGTSGTYRVDQSLDGGVSWTTLTSNRTGTNWPHTLPNVITSGLRYRVMDVSDTTRTAQSTTYSISDLPNPVQIISPNGLNTLIAGTTQQVSYSTPSTVTSVKLQWSSDGGQNWGTIYNGAPTGSYSWTVPNVATTTAKLRLQNNGNVCDYDESDSVFTILSSVQVQQPNGGEQWRAQVSTQQFIPNNTLNMSNATLEVNTLDYYDAGGTGSAPATAYTQTLVPDNPQNKLRIAFQSYRFDQPANSYYYGADGYLRVYNGPTTSSSILATLTNNDGGQVYTSSHYTGALTIQYVPENHSSTGYRDFHARVTSVGTPTKEIKWSVVGTSEKYHLDYSTDGGSSWKRIVTGYEPVISSAGIAKYDWQVPNAVTSTAKVRVVDVANGNIIDETDGLFEILPAIPFIDITNFQNEGRVYPDQVKTITWKAPKFNVSHVRIELTKDYGNTWTLVADNLQNTGSYVWAVPSTIDTVYSGSSIRISAMNKTYVYDETPYFELRPAVIITSPNGNQSNYRSCTASSITWEGDATNSYKIELSVDSGQTYSVIASNYTSSSLSHNYSWTIPNSPSSNCLARVTANNNADYTDVSDAVFEILPSVELLTFKYGGTISAGTSHTILWNGFLTSNTYNISYSPNNGTSWVPIVTNYSSTTGAYNWSVPASLNGSSVLVKVTDYNNSCKSDESELPMKVLANPLIAVQDFTSPLSSCGTDTVKWTSSAGVDTVNILLSKDYGATWGALAMGITSSSTGVNEWYWSKNNYSTPKSILKVVQSSNPQTYDHTDSLVNVSNGISLEIIASQQLPCSGDTVTLSITGAAGLDSLKWSSGETLSTIHVTSSGTYYVTGYSNSCSGVSPEYTAIFQQKPQKPVIQIVQNGSCQGDTIILNSSAAVNNIWSPSLETTQSIRVASSGTYTVIVTNESGCSSVSNPLVVSLNPKPTNPTLTSNAPVNLADTLKLYASTVPNASYQWSGPSGFVSTVQNPTLPNADTTMEGYYYCAVEVNGCSSNESALAVFVNRQYAPHITGASYYYDGALIGGVNYQMSGLTSNLAWRQNDYLFPVFSGGSYTITASKNGELNKSKGLSTLDLLTIQRHVVMLDTITNPYLKVAADVNQNGGISTFDALIAQRTILSLDTVIANASNWVFLDSASTVSSTYPYGNSTASVVAQTGENRVSFYGIRLGDVNGSWSSTGSNKSAVKTQLGVYKKLDSTGAQLYVVTMTDRSYGFEFFAYTPLDYSVTYNDQYVHAENNMNDTLHSSAFILGNEYLNIGDTVLTISIEDSLHQNEALYFDALSIEGTMATKLDEELDIELTYISKGIGLPEWDDRIFIHPNPTSSHITISGVPMGVDYRLHDLTGRVVNEGKLTNDTFSLIHLPDGVYYLELFGEGFSVKRKIVKVH